MSFRQPQHPRLLSAHVTLAVLLAQPILVERHVEYESDDQGGRHAMPGLALTLIDGKPDARPVIIFDRTRADSLPYFSEEDRASIAQMLGCRVDQLMEPAHAPAFFPALDELRFGLALSLEYEPYEIEPMGAMT